MTPFIAPLDDLQAPGPSTRPEAARVVDRTIGWIFFSLGLFFLLFFIASGILRIDRITSEPTQHELTDPNVSVLPQTRHETPLDFASPNDTER